MIFINKILIIEDDLVLANGLNLALKETKNIIVNNIKSARNELENNKFNLIILDINLPDGNGIEFLKQFRKKDNTPIIILTANDIEIDIVTGLESGANDYITKPFSLAIFRARVNNQLKNNKFNTNKIVIDNFIFDFDNLEYYVNNELIELSKIEQKLLKILIENKGITLSREILINKIWIDNLNYVDENALSVSIKRLRDKLEENPKNPKYIKTVYGIGYIWVVN